MTKKDFKELASIHKYGHGRNENNLTAIFYDWKSDDKGNGFKYCVFARQANATTEELLNVLYNFVTGKTDDIKEWWIQLIYAETDDRRFKVPLSSSGLNTMKGKYVGVDE
jgi:hypothetical protein